MGNSINANGGTLMNYTRFLIYLILAITLIFPIAIHLQYAYGSNELTKVNYIAVKEDVPDYIERINLSGDPIVNTSSVEKFIKEAFNEIWNYSVKEELNGNYKGEKYFTEFGFEVYKEVKERYNKVLDEREAVLVYSVISNDIYLTGIAEPKIGNKQYMYDFQIITTIKGLGGKQQSKRSVTIILKQDGVINNRYGIAIDSIAIN